MKLQELKKEIINEEDKLERDLAFQSGLQFELARIHTGLTQKKLAKKMGTKQPAIARVESGSFLPSLGFFERAAKAMGTYIIGPKFAFLEKNKGKHKNSSSKLTEVFQTTHGNNPEEEKPSFDLTIKSPYCVNYNEIILT